MDGSARELRTAKFQMMLEPSTVQAVEEWKWRNRIGSRAQAVRLLIQKGLAAESQDGGKAATGAEFGDDTPAAVDPNTAVSAAGQFHTQQQEC